MTRVLLASLALALLGGCGLFGGGEPVVVTRDHYERLAIPRSLTDPVPPPPVPPPPVTESQAIERDAALVEALALCNLQKREIRSLVEAPPLPSEDQRAK